MDILTTIQNNWFLFAIAAIGFIYFTVKDYLEKDDKIDEETVQEEEEEETWQCNVCEEWKERDEVIEFDTTDAEIGICKSCIDKAYPREIIEKEVVKYIEPKTKESSSTDIDFEKEEY